MLQDSPSIFAMSEWRRGEFRLHVRRVENQAPTLRHEHIYHEVVLVESGTAEHLSVDGVKKLRPGDILSLKPGMWHQYLRPESLVIINCVFDVRLLRQYGAMLSLGDRFQQLFFGRASQCRQIPPTFLHSRPATFQNLLQNLESMMNEHKNQASDWKLAMISKLIQFLIDVSRLNSSHQEQTPIMPNRASEAVMEVTAFLETHFAEDLSLHDLATRFHISDSYLSRTFKRWMGVSITQYINHLRIEEACRHLQLTNAPITHIAGLVGYEEIAYFSYCFKKEVGVSPREYRLKYRALPDYSATLLSKTGKF